MTPIGTLECHHWGTISLGPVWARRGEELLRLHKAQKNGGLGRATFRSGKPDGKGKVTVQLPYVRDPDGPASNVANLSICLHSSECTLCAAHGERLSA